MGRHTSWRFKSLLTVTPELAQCINDIHHSEDALKRILSSQILNGCRPDHLVNVEVRFARSDLNHGFSELPLEGYVQSKLKLEEYIMHRWFSAAWSPVGGRCNSSDAYRSFRHPIPIISVSRCTEKQPSTREDGQKNKKRCPYLSS